MDLEIKLSINALKSLFNKGNCKIWEKVKVD